MPRFPGYDFNDLMEESGNSGTKIYQLYFVRREYFPPDSLSPDPRFIFHVPSWIVSIDGVDQILVPVALDRTTVARWQGDDLTYWTPQPIPGLAHNFSHDITQIRTDQRFER